MTGISHRKRIRIDPENYERVGQVASVTIATLKRRTVFAEPPMARAAVEALSQIVTATGVQVHAYCVMPDHFHLLLEPSATCDITSFRGRFKGLAQRFVWRLGVSGLVWQRSYFDHFLRKEENLHVVVRYVISNPVRAGLAQDWCEYPYCGSFVWDLNDGI